MEFDEVRHFVKHGKVAPIDERNIDALGVASPFYPTFPCPQPIATATTTQRNNKKRALTAKFVSSVRHRLQKSATTTSDDDDDNPTDGRGRGHGDAPRQKQQQQQQQQHQKQHRRTGRHYPLFQRLKKSHVMPCSTPRSTYSSSGEEIDGGYMSFDDVQQRWQKQRRQILRRPASLVPSQLQQRYQKSKQKYQKVGVDDDRLLLMGNDDFRQINDQMKRFRVPADWAILDDHPPISPLTSFLPMPAKHSITAKRMMTDLTNRIEQYQYLCAQEQKRIKANKQAIEDHMTMLCELDRNVEVLNAKIGHARTEKLKRMNRMLRNTQRRSPYLLGARAVHKKTLGSIEGYLKTMNYASRLVELRLKVDHVRDCQVIWSQVQQWVPSVVISLVLVILISYISTL